MTSSDAGKEMALDGHAQARPPEKFEPVAVIGMGCRWPENSTHPSELWEFLLAKRHAYSDFPSDRINGDAFYHKTKGRPGSFYSRGGCFLNSSPYEFDHTFFGINPQEAASMDPAQRKLLETVYEAFEASGTPAEKVSGSRTGCFVGSFNRDHSITQYRDSEFPEPYAATGGGDAILSNRINYIFNLKGPSLTIDTACSSSLYALHLACSAIQNNECDGAIVAGANLILTPDAQIFSANLGAISATSRCHTFDAAADGYARADGTGALYIKKLADAIRDKDPVRAIIRGTAVNSNGKTGGITRPSSQGQEDAIRQAYKRAGGLDYATTGYVECHGTGTPVGDPLEMAAIGRVFAPGRSPSDPLLVGSIKSNIGHTEPASGIAGLMKTVLALEHGIIPANVGFKNLNPEIDLQGGRLKIVTENTKWPEGPVRRASVNSFGYGGANAHIIIDAAASLLPGYSLTKTKPIDTTTRVVQARMNGINGFRDAIVNGQGMKQQAYPADSDEQFSKRQGSKVRDQFLLVLSAHNERTLEAVVATFQDAMNKYRLIDLAHTLAVRRSTLTERCFFIAGNSDVSKGLVTKGKSPFRTHGAKSSGIAFCFTGQGAQWSRMGGDLMQSFPSYLETIRHLDRVLRSLRCPPTWTLEGVFRDASEKEMGKAEISQPATTALQIALINLLFSWNIKPTVNAGHSSGEIGAAYASGKISMEEAIIVAFFRGRAVSRNDVKGLMLAVGAGEVDVRLAMDDRFPNVTIACHNSPNSVTLSGDSDEVLAAKSVFEGKNLFTKLVPTGGNAYHSPHMQKLGSTYETEMTENYSPASRFLPESKFVSSVTGKVEAISRISPGYWRRNLESPVLFREAIEAMLQAEPIDAIIEIGPHPSLRHSLQQIAASKPNAKFPQYIPTLTRSENSTTNLLRTAGNLWAGGYAVDLERVNAVESIDSTGTLVLQSGNVIGDLPRYQWRYEKPLTHENRWTREWRLRKHPRHDLLGSRTPGGMNSVPTWRNILRHKDLPWLGDHRLGTEIVFPATGYLSMAIEAITQMWELDGHDVQQVEAFELQNVNLAAALLVPEDDQGIEVLLNLHPQSLTNKGDTRPCYRFLVTSVVDAGGESIFTEHAHGQISLASKESDGSQNDYLCRPSTKAKHAVAAAEWYETFARLGLCYGPTFRGLDNIEASSAGNIAKAKLSLKPNLSAGPEQSRHVIHPAAFDSFLQLSLVASHSGKAHRLKKRYLPVSFQRITVQQPCRNDFQVPTDLVCAGGSSGARALTADLRMTGLNNRVLIDIENAQLLALDRGPLDPQQDASTLSQHSPYTRMVWTPDFDSLTTAAATTLYPPKNLDDRAVAPLLDNLALHQIIHFKRSHPQTFRAGSDKPHLQNLLDWMSQKTALAEQGQYPRSRDILSYPPDQLADEIDILAKHLAPSSPESRTMCQIHRNLPAIFRGEKTGIQVALENNALQEMYEKGQMIDEGNRRLAAMVALFARGRGRRVRILEVGAGTGSATREVLAALRGEGEWRMYEEYVFTDVTPSFLSGAREKLARYQGVTYETYDMQKVVGDKESGGEFDLVIASNVVHASLDIVVAMRNIRSRLKTGGKIVLLEITRPLLFAGLLLGTFSDFWNGTLDPSHPRHDGPFMSKSTWNTVFSQSGFSELELSLDDYAGQPSSSVLISTAVDTDALRKQLSAAQTKGLTVVYRNAPTAAVSAFSQQAALRGFPIDSVSLSSSQSPKYTQLIFLVEVESPLFDTIDPVEWQNLQRLMQQASDVLWVTNGGLLSGREPLFAMIGGIVRGLKTERSSLRVSTLDLDLDVGESLVDHCDTIFAVWDRLSQDNAEGYTLEYRQKNHIIYRSSLEPDEILNSEMENQAKDPPLIHELPLHHFTEMPLQVNVDHAGTSGAIFFDLDPNFDQALPETSVEIEVSAVGVSSKCVAAMSGNVGSRALSNECAGTIRQVGAQVKGLVPGDRVYCLCSTKFGNFVRVKSSLCQKVEGMDSFEKMATMPASFCSAVYGLMDLARLSQGETVLIDGEAESLGWAAVQISNLCGAEIYVVVPTLERKEALLKGGLGLEADHIIWPSEKRTAQRLRHTTAQKGFDVIYSCSREWSTHGYQHCLAAFGRFIEMGSSDDSNDEDDGIRSLRSNTTFTSVDLNILVEEKPAVATRLMATVQDLHRKGSIWPAPCTTVSVTQIKEAFGFCPDKSIASKAVVTFNDKSATIKFRESPPLVKFDPNATYLLVGGLGGLGQTYTRWMVERGATSFVYLSRSGKEKQETCDFLAELEDLGVDAKVVKGDVCSLHDVRRAVASAMKPIKGAVQAALTLQDKSFERMTLEEFQATVQPRVRGTMNLHVALEHSPLDFFMMWSSWTAIFGTATQANYLASSAFMDAFARHRQRSGLPATSLSLNRIGNVGAVGRHQIDAQVLARNGFYGNNEDEFLEYCESAISPYVGTSVWKQDPLAKAHLLAGIEPEGLRTLDKTYPLRDMSWYHDRRFGNLINAVAVLSSADEVTVEEADEQADEDKLVDRIHKKVAQLLYTPMKNIDVTRALSDYGIDSMIAAELRNWIFGSFAKDVSLFSMLSQATTIEKLALDISEIE